MKATMPPVGDDDLSEDSDEGPSHLSDGELSTDPDSEEADEIDEDDSQLVEGSDNEDLIILDGDSPEGLIEYEGSSEDEDQWAGVGDGDERGEKRKREKGMEQTGSRRKKLRSLPTFASYEEYAEMIEAQEDGS
jgi:ribosome biogenesis protein MAK21